MRKALATFAGHQGSGVIDGNISQPQVDPVQPEEELITELDEAIALVKGFLTERKSRLEDVMKKKGFEKNKAIDDAKNAINENDENRKRFEILAREVFKKFKACITIKGVNAYRHQYDAINIIYKSLQKDVYDADISDIIKALHEVIDEAVEPCAAGDAAEAARVYDISKIDFDRLRKEYEKRHGGLKTAVQSIKAAVEARLLDLLAKNPLRTNLQKKYEEIIAAYNNEKDRVTIEKTFEELLQFAQSMDNESRRSVGEGLDEESLALFDLLYKPELSAQEIRSLKKVAKGLLEKLKAEKLRVDNWRDKQATRDALLTEIRDFLWSDDTGLPEQYYTQAEVDERAYTVYQHIFARYQDAYHSVYTS